MLIVPYLQEGLINSEDNIEINILLAATTFMRHFLAPKLNLGYFECLLPAYSIDEF